MPQANNLASFKWTLDIALLSALSVIVSTVFFNTSFAQMAVDSSPQSAQITQVVGIQSTDNCSPNAASPQIVDRARSIAHTGLCKSVRWVDSLFGDEEDFQEEAFSGKLTLGYRLDEEDGFDPKVRIRIKSKLPNVSRSLNAFIGQVDEDDYISDTEINNNSLTNSGLRSDDDEDTEWLIGLGYQNPNKEKNGMDYSIGAKISGGIKPYAKARYKHLFNLNQFHYLKATQTLFWRSGDAFGFSTSLDYTYIINTENIYQASASARYTQDENQWEWLLGNKWHHALTKNRGLTTRIYVRGEEKNPISIPEYGATFTYRQPFLRPWLYLETGFDYRWKKELGDEDYKGAARYGFQLEFLLGDYKIK